MHVNPGDERHPTDVVLSTEFSRVVVGMSTVDRLGAVRWAAAEARARHAELRLVVAAGRDEVAEDRGIAVARLLGDLARAWPDLAVIADVADGPPDAVLRDATEEADLLVVGADDDGPFAASGSWPGDLVAAHCSLAVVPRQGWGPAPVAAPVVVALDELDTTQAAVAYGYVAAARSGRPLTLLRRVAAGRRGDVITLAQARLLVAYGELYPDVPVTDHVVADIVAEVVVADMADVVLDVVSDDPRQVLAAASRRAALLVLGSPGLSGSLGHDLVRRGGCPVVLARTQPSALAMPL